jgi:hypothetical protein
MTNSSTVATAFGTSEPLFAGGVPDPGDPGTVGM